MRRCVELTIMNIFQVVFKGGLTRNIAADLYTSGSRRVRFYSAGRLTATFERRSILVIDHPEASDYAAPRRRPQGLLPSREA
jgi:hypothetical protein